MILPPTDMTKPTLDFFPTTGENIPVKPGARASVRFNAGSKKTDEMPCAFSASALVRHERRAPQLMLVRSALVAMLAVIGLAILSACKPPGGGPPRYETEPAVRGDVVQHVTASGTLGAVVSVDVGSQVSGKIVALYVDYNSPVKKGQLVAEIDPTIYAATLRQVEGELASANASVTLKRQNLERKKTLLPLKAASQLDLDQAVAELAQAEANITIKQASLESAQANLGYCKITAPVDGIVIARRVDLGQTMTAGFTTPVLFTIAQDISKMHIAAAISEADIGQVKDGQPVDFTVDAFSEETFHGKVTQVRKSPTTTQNVVTYETIITVDNPEQKLFPGMTADVSILVAERKEVVTIPNTALRYTPPDGVTFEQAPPKNFGRSQRLVYALGANPSTLKPVLVKAGITDGVDTEILEGLDERAAVVTSTLSSPAKGGFGGGPPGGGQAP
jgi:HlyD family secretion protein